MTLRDARRRFRDMPNRTRAASYMRALLAAERDDLINDDTFLDGLSEVADWLAGDR